MTSHMRRILTDIALRELQIPTLETRGRDRLDFHEVSVFSLAEALTAAYEAGQNDAKLAQDIARLQRKGGAQFTPTRALRKLIDRADDLIAAIEGTTDQFETEVGRLQAAVTKAEQVLKGGAA
jgi:hypothetical protein